eukprot:1142455-Pelagomonas_calceolata.AAC.2
MNALLQRLAWFLHASDVACVRVSGSIWVSMFQTRGHSGSLAVSTHPVGGQKKGCVLGMCVGDVCWAARDVCWAARDVCWAARSVCWAARDVCWAARDVCWAARDVCWAASNVCWAARNVRWAAEQQKSYAKCWAQAFEQQSGKGERQGTCAEKDWAGMMWR